MSQVSTETGGHHHQTALGIASKERLGFNLREPCPCWYQQAGESSAFQLLFSKGGKKGAAHRVLGAVTADSSVGALFI